MADNLPSWAEELRLRYLKGEASQFILYGDVYDLIRTDDRGFEDLEEFLTGRLLKGNKEAIVVYNPATGLHFVKKPHAPSPWMEELEKSADLDLVLPGLERLLLTGDRTAVIVEYAEMVAPAAEVSFMFADDRRRIVTLHRWSLMRKIQERDSVVILIAETLSDLSPKLLSNPKIATIKVPLPDLEERRRLVRALEPETDAATVERLAGLCGGLKTVQIKDLLAPLAPASPELAERERFFRRMQSREGPEADALSTKLARMTREMDVSEIEAFFRAVRPEAAEAGGEAPEAPAVDPYREVEALVLKRKREILEKECFGLVEFVEPRCGFEAVGGMEEVKRTLLDIASHMREGRTSLAPMGLLFVGPMGTGKTFLAEAFAKESGLAAVKLKNFRSKWVGATEANLEKVLRIVKAVGKTILIVDEGERSFGGEEGDSGVTSRVIARIKEFMSDPTNRGEVLFILMTNRPDKLDTDIKRAGRLDRKIPFFPPETPEEVEAILAAQLRRHGADGSLASPEHRVEVSAPLVGYSAADLEAIVLLALRYGHERDAAVDATLLKEAAADYLPSRDEAMLEYMELLAVFETSNRSMLPARYREISPRELHDRLAELRREVKFR